MNSLVAEPFGECVYLIYDPVSRNVLSEHTTREDAERELPHWAGCEIVEMAE